MRYRFRGLLRDTGKPVEGHVEAPSVDQAYALMGDNGIVCESLREDPRMGDFTSPNAPAPDQGGDSGGDDFTNAIDSALDTSSTQVNVDDLWRKYRGQRVRVIDRDKIRNRVMSVVSKAMIGGAGSGAGGAGETQTLKRVEEALTKMFGDNQNLTSEVNPGVSGPVNAQIGQLADMMLDLQKSMAELKALVRKGGGGGGGWGGGGGGGGGQRGAMIRTVKDPKNDKVLLEIFETNVKLQKSTAARVGAAAVTPKGPSEAAKRIAAQTAAKKAAQPPPTPSPPA